MSFKFYTCQNSHKLATRAQAMEPGDNHPQDDDESFGIGIGGALQEQCAAWGHAKYAYQVTLGIGTRVT